MSCGAMHPVSCTPGGCHSMSNQWRNRRWVLAFRCASCWPICVFDFRGGIAAGDSGSEQQAQAGCLREGLHPIRPDRPAPMAVGQSPLLRDYASERLWSDFLFPVRVWRSLAGKNQQARGARRRRRFPRPFRPFMPAWQRGHVASVR